MLNEFDEHVRQLHEQAIVIDALGGYGFAYDDILSGGIHTTHVTLNMYAAEGFDYVLNQIRRYYSLLEMQHDHLTLIESLRTFFGQKKRKNLV